MPETRSALVCFLAFGCVFAAHRDPQCEYENGQLSCICREDVYMTLSYIPPDANSLMISNCEQVSFGGTPFKDLELERLEIANSSSVKLQESTFLGVRKINEVEIVNLSDLQIKSLYFLKADKVELRNVTIKTLEKYAIPGVATIKELRFEDSIIGTLKNGSLHFGNDFSLEIIGCKIGIIEGNSLTVENVVNFTIQRSEFTLEEDALNLINVTKVSIDHNEIHLTLIASFLASNIGEFVVSHNNFRHVGAQTFYHMENVDKVVVENNRFIRVDDEGLEFNPEVGKSLFIVRNNSFICDCSLFWLWREQKHPNTDQKNPEFRRILNSSFCDRPDVLTGLRLLDVTPLVRRDTDECIRMEAIVEDKKQIIRRFVSKFRSSSAASKATEALISVNSLTLATFLIVIHTIHLWRTFRRV